MIIDKILGGFRRRRTVVTLLRDFAMTTYQNMFNHVVCVCARLVIAATVGILYTRDPQNDGTFFESIANNSDF